MGHTAIARIAAQQRKAAAAAPMPARPRHVAGAVGNQAFLRRLSAAPAGLQRKLRIGSVDDPLEREADQIANEAMRLPAPARDVTPAPPALRQKCAACEKKEDEAMARVLRPKAARSSTVADGGEAPAHVHGVLRTAGEPLDATIRADMEQRLAHDFSHVRVHRDPSAVDSARLLGARAYTVGSHIAFAPGEYQTHTPGGRQLLAHELVHVLQQEGGGAGRRTAGATPVNASVVSRQQGDAAPEATGGSAACTQVPPTFTFGTRVRFGKDSDQPLPGQEALIAKMVTEANAAEAWALHGNASQEGNAAYNLDLSCRRALTVEAILARAGVTAPPTRFAHGATGLYGNEDIDNRNVVLATTAAKPKGEKPAPEPAKKKTCGVTGAFDNIPSGTLLPTLHTRDQVTWELGARFAMTATFSPVVGPGEDPARCNCRCGEYRQCVKSTHTINGERVTSTPCVPTAHSNDFCSGEFHEDCVPTEKGDAKYGYHDIFFQNSQFSRPNQQTGCRFEGLDEPFTAGHKGDLLGLQAHFQGKLIDTCNNNEVLDSSEWEVVGTQRVPS